MNYQVIHNGNVIGSFQYFVDAWLYIYLDLPCYARIKGFDIDMIVNPPRAN